MLWGWVLLDPPPPWLLDRAAHAPGGPLSRLAPGHAAHSAAQQPRPHLGFVERVLLDEINAGIGEWLSRCFDATRPVWAPPSALAQVRVGKNDQE